jgi:hypothetical protein
LPRLAEQTHLELTDEIADLDELIDPIVEAPGKRSSSRIARRAFPTGLLAGAPPDTSAVFDAIQLVVEISPVVNESFDDETCCGHPVGV